MNVWAKRTLQLVTTQDYLDKLQTVYPHEDAEREVDYAVLKAIKKSFVRKDDKVLLNELLNLEKFP